MDIISGFWHYGVVFLLVLGLVVFIHEFGHYAVARWCKVKIEVFAIGFGPELFGWNDRAGTRWKVCLLPLGGYVKMCGDADATSARAEDRPMSEEEKSGSFHSKTVGQRAAIAFAGPAANFIFALVVLMGLFMAMGQPVSEPVIGKVIENSAAAEAGLQPGDRILSINGKAIDRFQDVRLAVQLGLDAPLALVIDRNGSELNLTVRPKMEGERPILGVTDDPSRSHLIRHNPLSAVVAAYNLCEQMISGTFVALGQMISGTRSSEELSGPIGIARGLGDAAQAGLGALIGFTAFLSLSLGLINLFPIPILDGGQLVFYAVEAVRGKPVGERVQEYSFRVGLFLVLALMIFATRNDIVSLPLWQKVASLWS